MGFLIDPLLLYRMLLYGGAPNVPPGMLFSFSHAGIYGNGGMDVSSKAALYLSILS